MHTTSLADCHPLCVSVRLRSVERMIEYNTLQPEAAAIVEGHRPLPGWPQQVRRAHVGLGGGAGKGQQNTAAMLRCCPPRPCPPSLCNPLSVQGAIDVQQLVVRYRPDLDPVLKSISFSVRGREKVSRPVFALRPRAATSCSHAAPSGFHVGGERQQRRRKSSCHKVQLLPARW